MPTSFAQGKRISEAGDLLDGVFQQSEIHMELLSSVCSGRFLHTEFMLSFGKTAKLESSVSSGRINKDYLSPTKIKKASAKARSVFSNHLLTEAHPMRRMPDCGVQTLETLIFLVSFI